MTPRFPTGSRLIEWAQQEAPLMPDSVALALFVGFCIGFAVCSLLVSTVFA